MNTPRWVTPRRLGAAAAIYGVFVSGWYLGQPVTPECRVDQAALDRITEEYETGPTPTPTPTRTAYPPQYDSETRLPRDPTPEPFHDLPRVADDGLSVTLRAYAVACVNDTSERPRLQGWFEGHWW
ncbi:MULTISPECIES: hypothetical protein [unclassified Streptomyces]|uniref:hypothetical protein n=1 Tax=unclassified Streptomyces TaxID=2593676 RepID=UPI002877C037|nr:hypothetical protein [Streptomyces sp. BB1-1-1]WND39801.1 hypothetical protein RI578_38365 [Streptomyces sp. BB1-1-1]